MLPFTIMQFNTVSAQIGKGPRAAISCEIEHTVFKGSVLRSFIKERTTSLIHSEVSNVFITDVFTPKLILGNQLLGASRAVSPLPTHIDELETRARTAQRPHLGKCTASLQLLAEVPSIRVVDLLISLLLPPPCNRQAMATG